ncbi:hypothetical protein QW131_11005 [Roseibium salinum]|nr:hypothetical protein [Roseibium salinum]
MGKLTYGMMMSLDGFVADPSDHFDEDALGFINDEMRKLGTEIYGRRMYESMVYWETFSGKRVEPNTPTNLLVSGRNSISWSSLRASNRRRVARRGSCASSGRRTSGGSRRNRPRTFRSPVRPWQRHSSKPAW